LEVAARRSRPASPGHKTLKLHLFLDKSTLEVFVDDRTAMTRVLYPPENDWALRYRPPRASRGFDLSMPWKIRPIW